MATERSISDANNPRAEDLTPAQLVAIGLLLAGRPYADVAREVGIDTRILFQWRQQPAFIAELRSQFELMHAATRYGLFSLASESISALRHALKGQSETARVSAAQIVLDRLGVGRAGDPSALLSHQSELDMPLADAEIDARARHLLRRELSGLDDTRLVQRVRELIGEH